MAKISYEEREKIVQFVIDYNKKKGNRSGGGAKVAAEKWGISIHTVRGFVRGAAASTTEWPEEKALEILEWIKDYDKKHGKGGTMAAIKEFKVPKTTLLAWKRNVKAIGKPFKPKKKRVTHKNKRFQHLVNEDYTEDIYAGLTPVQAAHKYYLLCIEKALESGEETRRAVIRELGRKDLFFLMMYILGFNKFANDEWCFARAREVQASLGKNTLDLWARGHFKSSIITFAATIFELINNPELTFGFFSFTRPIAKAFLIQIKRELETNEFLKDIYRDVFWQAPERQSPKWTEEAIVIRRKGNPKEATIEAWGLTDGMPTSKHYDRLIYDDPVTDRSVTSEEMIKKTRDAFDLSDNLGKSGTVKRVIGTRYHHFDLYNDLISNGEYLTRVYPATDDGTIHGNPVLLTRDELATKRRNQTSYIFSAQMLLNPDPDKTQGFDENWLKYWNATNLNNLNFYLFVDPSSGKNKTKGDFTVMWLIGVGDDGNYYVVDVIRDRLSLTEKGDALFEFHRKYEPRVYYEEVGMQADIQYFNDRMDRENYRFTINPMTTKGVKKERRIDQLEPLFREGKIYLPHRLYKTLSDGSKVDVIRSFIVEEYTPYPYGKYDDMLDSLSMITQVKLTKPMRRKRKGWNASSGGRAIFARPKSTRGVSIYGGY